MPKKKHSTNRHLPKDLQILYEDDYLLVVDKPAGLLTVQTETNKTRTAQYILTDYVRRGNYKSRNRVFTVHRLDQWTSGVLIFANSEEIKMQLQAQWKDTEKKYIAIVHGRMPQKEGIISSYLAENKAFKAGSMTRTAPRASIAGSRGCSSHRWKRLSARIRVRVLVGTSSNCKGIL